MEASRHRAGRGQLKGSCTVRSRPWLVSLVLPAVFWCTLCPGQSPPLVPLDDPFANAPMLPGGINRNVPEVFGNYAHIWSLTDTQDPAERTQVLQYFGDFSLHLGDRSLRSQDAVVWVQKSIWERTTYYHFEVYLSRFATVKESAGTVTTGPVLFVTFNTLKPPVVYADVSTGVSSESTPLYLEAARIRQSTGSGLPGEPGDLNVTRLEQRPGEKPPKARPLVRVDAGELLYQHQEGIVTATNHVTITQGLLDSNQFLQIRAKAAVVFMAKREQAEPGDTPAATSLTPGGEPFPTENLAAPAARGQGLGSSGLGGEMGEVDASGVYLEGDVVLSRGDRTIRAAELYYDFENDRALILDAVMRASAPGRSVPIYVRAARVRQLSSTEYFARKAIVTSSEFYTPHIHLGADRVYLSDTTPRDETGQITGFMAGKYKAYDTTVNVEGVPVAYWPYTAGDFRQVESPLKQLRVAFSDDFGATFESQWYLFNLLGIEKPQGVDAALRLDYYSKRGPGVGLDVNYENQNSYGLFRGYYIHDTGKDNLGPFRSGEPDTENRGRITWRHRQFLPQGWELTLEGSYISDPNFLEEFFRSEFEEGKEQETLAYLKKQQDNWAFTTLAQVRVLDFLTQTDHLPDTAFQWVGEPLGEVASLFNESRIGWVRYKPDNRRIFENESVLTHQAELNDVESRIVFRPDQRSEVDVPIKLGSVNLVPYAMGRATYWDDSPWKGPVDRVLGQLGVRTGTQFWRVFQDATSKLLDVTGVRHILRPEATAWLSGGNRDSRELHPFDYGIESIDDFYGASLALRNTWQTKRGPLGQQRTVDWIKFDIELNVFGNQPKFELPIGRFYDYRPENSIARNHVRTDFQYRISDTTAILSETNWDLNDGSADLFDVSYAVERTPRFSYFVGYRRIHDTNSNLVGGGANYELNEKHRIAVRGYYDLDRGETHSFDVSIIRKWPRWYTALTFQLDKIEEDFSVGLSVWPEGAPNVAVGSRRFTSLSESTGIRPED